MDVRDFLRVKRDGGRHPAAAIRDFVRDGVSGRIPEYQISAWLMAAFLRGLDGEETRALTEALTDSGQRFDWSDLGRPTADKHSTGGVGDKVSLVLAPLVAACGVAVPMVAGRGLGHTGGTIDKLEAIPGYRTRLSPEAMRRQLETIGVVVIGQGPEMAPADGLLYGLRDVTSTVEFEPFIVSSIVSKKVAEGAGTLVYDVKCGNGAFMRTLDEAHHLATALVDTTRAMGRAAAARVTDMNQPLGAAVGNALEVRESVELLRGGGPGDVHELTIELGVSMLRTSGAERSAEAARQRLQQALDSGDAWSRFLALVEAQGGDPRAVERDGGLGSAPVVLPVPAARAGWVTSIDTFALGRLAVALGAGRRAKEDAIDPRVGFVMRVRLGDRVEAGQTLAEIHTAEDRPDALAELAQSITLGDEQVEAPELIVERID
jgi:pyrimidine-nucleoside phosphorylase